MFTIEQRDHVRERVVALAQADPRVTAGALTGSMALGAENGWPDIDVAFGITDGISLDAVLQDWTTALDQEFRVLALACNSLGENAFHGRGVDRLPATITDPLSGALVRSLDELELRRALTVATTGLLNEIAAYDPALCERIMPLLSEFSAV